MRSEEMRTGGCIFGLIGKAGAGKDTVFQIIYDIYEAQFIRTLPNKKIEKEYHQQFINFKFASKLKEVCSVITGYPVETFYNRDKYNDIIPMLDISIRQMMQQLGEGMRIVLHSDLWVRAAFSKLRPGSSAVFTDVRYPNEIQALKNHNAILIKIERNHEESTIIGEQANHSSETALNNVENSTFNYIINNNGTLEELRIKVKEIMIKEGLCRMKD